MENESAEFLKVPITETERKHARSRSHSNERLLPDSAAQHSDRSYPSGPTPLRFPSIHAPGTRILSPVHAHSPENQRYAPISPIDEEDAGIGNGIPLRRRTIYQANKSYQPLEPIPDLWTPIWLRKPTLAAFAVFFTALLIAILVLWVVSHDRDGFHVSNPDGHQAWAYVPTIIMVIVVALWRQVDYQTKSLIPWDELQKGPVGPSKSLLLDYVSPFQLVSLFESFTHGHTPVIATILSFVLLKIITIFSTGVFILLPTIVTNENFPLTATTKFDASSFNPQANVDVSSFSSSPVYSYYGTLARGLPFQPGVLSDLTYSPITFDQKSTSSFPQNATLSGEVDAFIPLMDCHPIDVKLGGPTTVSQSNTTDAYGSGNLSLILPAGDVCGLWPSINISTFNPQTEIAPSRRISGTLQGVYCITGGNAQVDPSAGPAALLYTVTDILYHQDLFANASNLAGGSFTIAYNSSRTVQSMANVICKPSYTISRVKVSNDTTKAYEQNGGVVVSPAKTAQNRTLNQLSSWNMTSLFAATISAGDGLFGDADNADDVERASNTLFTLMAMYYNTQNLDILLDSGSLNTAAEATFKGVMAQYVHQSLTTPSANAISGTVVFQETRYHVNDVSAFAMVAGFAVAAISSALLIFIGPRRAAPRDPGSIAFLATTLSRSIELNRLLRREGVPSHQNQRSALEGFEFGTATATTDSGRSSFKIVTSEGLPEELLPKRETHLKWWQPITISIPFVAIVVAVPLALIAVLESLQRSSDRNHGIYSVPDSKATDIYTHYIPALVLLIAASLVNLVDFNIALFTPWSKLSKQDATHQQSVLSHLLGKSPPFAFLEAVRTKHFAAVLSLIAAVIASVLTIISTGLYTVTNYESAGTTLKLNRLDDFNLQWPNSFSNDNGAAGLTSLILHNNLSYPDFTYADLVFPNFSMNSLRSGDNESTVVNTASVKLPALRPNLRCDVIAAGAINLTTVRSNETAYGTDQAFLTVKADLPKNCQLGGYLGNGSSFQYELAFSLPSDGSSTFVGTQLDLLFGNYSAVYGNDGEANGDSVGDNPPVGCPSLAFVFGEFKLDSRDTGKVTTMVCYQEIQSVDANVTLHTNSTTIDANQPPVVDEKSVSLQTNPNSTTGVKSFDFRIENNIGRQLASFTGQGSVNDGFDRFFQAVLYNNSKSYNPESLLGSANEQELLSAIQRFYRTYMAQAIHANMRQPLSATNRLLQPRQSTSTLNDLTTKISTPRLVQNKSNKLALQILLGLTAGLTLGAYLISNPHHVLPCNPASIAGAMSLLAGSDLCHSHDDGLCECCGKPRRASFSGPPGSRPTVVVPESIHANDEDEDNEREQVIPDGTEWLDDKKFELAFAGRKYSMGWWRERARLGKRRRFGVDVGGRADGDDDQDWELGDRRLQGDGGLNEFMVSGGRGQRDRGMYEPVGAKTRGASHSPEPLGRSPAQGRGNSLSGLDGEA